MVTVGKNKLAPDLRLDEKGSLGGEVENLQLFSESAAQRLEIGESGSQQAANLQIPCYELSKP